MAQPGVHTFRTALQQEFAAAEARGDPSLEISAGDLHRQVGGYPGVDHRMPSCCAAMRFEEQPSDELMHAPPSGKGAALRIRYRLPRS